METTSLTDGTNSGYASQPLTLTKKRHLPIQFVAVPVSSSSSTSLQQEGRQDDIASKYELLQSDENNSESPEKLSHSNSNSENSSTTSGKMCLWGQPTVEHLKWARSQNCSTVVTLQSDSEVLGSHIPDTCVELGMEWMHVDFWGMNYSIFLNE